MKETYNVMLTTTDNPMFSERIETKGNMVGKLKVNTDSRLCTFEVTECKLGDQTTPCSDLILIDKCSEIQIDKDIITCIDHNGTWLFEIVK